MKTESEIEYIFRTSHSLENENSYLNIRKLSLYKTSPFIKNYSRKELFPEG